MLHVTSGTWAHCTLKSISWCLIAVFIHLDPSLIMPPISAVPIVIIVGIKEMQTPLSSRGDALIASQSLYG